MNICFAYIDGACRGNPGHSGIGVLIVDEDGNHLREIFEYIGEATNNQAEYKALLRLLKEVSSHPDFEQLKKLVVHSDSQLLVKQMIGEFKIKSKNIMKLHLDARQLLRQLSFQVEFCKIPREKNREADQLANLGIDGKLL